jgi:hypothetical protein
MSWQQLPMPNRSTISSGHLKAAEATDPYVASAVEISTPDHDGAAAMARTFVEEFARIGWSRDRIGRMFRQPRYVAAHVVYQTRGPEFVAKVIEEVLGPETPSEASEENGHG